MKIGSAAAVLIFMATPALSAASKTDNGVTFTCALTGSGNSGFDIYAKNDGPSDKVCSASCKLTKSDGKTQEWAYPKQGDPIKVSKASQKFWFGGEASVPGSPLSGPDVTKASCR